MSLNTRSRSSRPMMQGPYRDVIDRLREAGLRPTRQRIALGSLLLRGDPRHVSAEALHAEAEAAGISVSLATIYNTLHQFSKAGLLREVVVSPERSYFDTNIEQHHHFYNDESGALCDIPGDAIRLGALPEPPAGHRIEGVDIVVRVRSVD